MSSAQRMNMNLFLMEENPKCLEASFSATKTAMTALMS